MSIIRRNNSDWRSLRSEWDRLFEDFFTGGGRSLQGATGTQGSVWAPLADIREDKDNFIVTAELPGVKKDDISVELENNVLTLKGERRFEKKDEKENYHFVERSYGSFYRSFTLPRNVDAGKINASFEDGVLNISLPKAEEAKPRKVEIGAGGGKQQIEAKGKTMSAGAGE